MGNPLEFALTLTGGVVTTMEDEPFILWRPHYVEKTAPRIDQQIQGPWYAMKPNHARELAQELLRRADQVENRASLNAPGRTQ